MQITTVVECYIDPVIGTDITMNNTRDVVGKIIAAEYIGNYKWALTGDIDEERLCYLGWGQSNIIYQGLRVTNPVIFVNEYQDELGLER